MFRRDGCPWCAKWDREIYPIYPKTEFSHRAPLRLVNLDRDPAPSIVHAPIRYTPTFVLVEDGRSSGRSTPIRATSFSGCGWRNLLKQLPRPALREMPKMSSPPAGTTMYRGLAL